MPKGTRPQGPEERYQARLTTERGRAKSLLKKVEEEFKGVPKMPSTKNVKMGGDSLMRGLTALGVAINDGIRTLKGKDTSDEMKWKIQSLRRYLHKTRRMQKTIPRPGDIVDVSQELAGRPRDERDVPRRKKLRFEK